MQITSHHFQPHDLVAGHPGLDLVNTVTARDSSPDDWLADFGALLQWAGLSGRFEPRELKQLALAAARQPAAATAALGRCRQLREALHLALSALHQGRAAPAETLQTLHRLRQAASRRMVPVSSRQGVAWRATVDSAGLDLITDSVLADALALLSAPPLDRLRLCAGSHCGWLFIDSSKAGRRRWCDMATCGAANKASRFRNRTAGTRPAATASAKESA